MMSAHIDVATRSPEYGEYEYSKAKASPDTSKPLHIERYVVEPIPRMAKGSAKHSMINPNAKAAQNYYIVEDLA